MATIKEVVVPDIGGAADVDVIEVSVRPGDKVNAEQSLITLEGDKATMEIPSPFAGTVKELKLKVGDKVAAGKTILLMEVDGAGVNNNAQAKSAADASNSSPSKVTESKNGHVAASVDQENKSVTTAAKIEQANKAATTTAKSDQDNKSASSVDAKSEKEEINDESTDDEGDTYAGPGVRRLAREFGIDLSRMQGSGIKNRITKEDLQAFVKAQLSRASINGGSGLPSAPVVDFKKFGEVETKPLSKIKKLTGVNVHRSWVLVPHVTQFDEADITELEEFRKQQQALLEKDGIKLTPLIFIMKAVVACLKVFPTFNASLDATGENLILKKYFHIGVAVDTPDGLVVPVIRDVDKKGILDLAKELAEISAKARAKTITPNDMQGSCFTISSLGGIGGTCFTPIVNMPDVAILGVSKSSIKPVFKDGQFVPRLMLPLSLSYDHRVIDGAQGARFMVRLANYLSDIRKLLL